MSEWLSGMGAAVANHLWQSTAVAVVVWGATLLLRKNAARVRYGLWVAASVKFLVPFSLLIGLGGMLPRPQHAVVTMPVYSAVDEVGLPFSGVETVPVVSVDPTHAAMRPRHEWGTPAVWLAGGWLGGVVVVLGVWGGGWRKVTRTLRRAVEADNDPGREVRILRRVEAEIGGRGRPVALMLSREWMEPGMFGILRPVLIWPEGLSERLDDEHVEAIVAHELMHARRRDNLTAALHMLVEAVFWFHPLVWWMERRMVEERERACDEAVVEMGNRPGVYAESLLKAVRFCVESPLVCVAGVTGADLNRRVRSIMTLRLRKLGVAGKLALAALGFAAIAVPVAFGVVRMIPLYGQVFKATGPLPSYEVVVIKPSQEGARGASTEGEETHYLMTAKMLIQFAYGIFSPPKVMDLNVVGGPDWIDNDVFSIVGKMDSAEFDQEQKLGRSARHERRQLMEQSLLADRFKLKMHTETRDVPVYALTVIKGGPKMRPAKDVTGSAHVNPNPGSMAPEQLQRGLIVQVKGRNFVMTVKGMTLDFFVDALGVQKETAGKQVVNQTGLTGAYDFTLTWGPADSAAVDNGDANEVIEPPLFTAIQQQLGLKLADGKGPAEVVVIDHIEKPVFDSAVAAATSSAVATAVATGQRLLGNLVPAALVQEKAQTAATDSARQYIGDLPIPQTDAPAVMTGFGTSVADEFAGGRLDSKSDKRIFFFRMGWAYVLPSGLEFHEGETIVPYNGMPPHGTYGFDAQHVARRPDSKGLLAFIEQVMLDDGTNWRADHKQIEAYYAKHSAGWQAGAAARVVPVAFTQANSVPLGFEVVSIRPSNSGSPGVAWGVSRTGYSANNAPLARVILDAYLGASKSSVIGWPLDRVKGAPAWVMNVPYDITVKADDATIEEMKDLNHAQEMALVAPMLRSMLENRFKLVVQSMPVDVPGYALVVGKRGTKMKEVPPSEPMPANGMSFGGSWKSVARRTADGRQSGNAFLGITMAELTAFIGMATPVVDQTGLTGKYDVELAFMNTDPSAGGDGSAPEPDIAHAYDWEAIGLEMKPIKVPVLSVVIDHIERPSEN